MVFCNIFIDGNSRSLECTIVQAKMCGIRVFEKNIKTRLSFHFKNEKREHLHRR